VQLSSVAVKRTMLALLLVFVAADDTGRRHGAVDTGR